MILYILFIVLSLRNPKCILNSQHISTQSSHISSTSLDTCGHEVTLLKLCSRGNHHLPCFSFLIFLIVKQILLSWKRQFSVDNSSYLLSALWSYCIVFWLQLHPYWEVSYVYSLFLLSLTDFKIYIFFNLGLCSFIMVHVNEDFFPFTPLRSHRLPESGCLYFTHSDTC